MNKKAFTLVEMIVVISVIVIILAMVAVPAMNSLMNKTKITQTRATQRSVSFLVAKFREFTDCGLPDIESSGNAKIKSTNKEMTSTATLLCYLTAPEFNGKEYVLYDPLKPNSPEISEMAMTPRHKRLREVVRAKVAENTWQLLGGAIQTEEVGSQKEQIHRLVDGWGRDMEYANFILRSAGKDGEMNTQDDMTFSLETGVESYHGKI